jgi:hypothetical protein
MSSLASFKGHPLHPILVALPIGLWIFSLVSDLILKMSWGGPAWNDVALYTLGWNCRSLDCGTSWVCRFRQYYQSKDENDRTLAHDDQSVRRRSLRGELLAPHTAACRRQPTDYVFGRRHCANHDFGLAWR